MAVYILTISSEYLPANLTLGVEICENSRTNLRTKKSVDGRGNFI